MMFPIFRTTLPLVALLSGAWMLASGPAMAQGLKGTTLKQPRAVASLDQSGGTKLPVSENPWWMPDQPKSPLNADQNGWAVAAPLTQTADAGATAGTETGADAGTPHLAMDGWGGADALPAQLPSAVKYVALPVAARGVPQDLPFVPGSLGADNGGAVTVAALAAPRRGPRVHFATLQVSGPTQSYCHLAVEVDSPSLPSMVVGATCPQAFAIPSSRTVTVTLRQAF